MNKSESVKRCQRRKKQTIVDLFGGECCICGYNKCLSALEFHHLEKNEKEEEPAYIIMRWSFKRSKKELEKCILVCSNCHREIHAEEYSGLNTDLKKYVKPWLDKKCGFCKKEFITKDDESIYCSQSCCKHEQRKVERPSKEELIDLLKTTTWTQLGKMFGVSDNGVRKWAKNYKII